MNENKYEKKKLHRLSLDIDKELLQEIKIRSARLMISMKRWIIRSIIEKIKQEDSFK